MCVYVSESKKAGLPWWPSGWDSALWIQGAQVQSLAEELDPTKIEDPRATGKTQCKQINK